MQYKVESITRPPLQGEWQQSFQSFAGELLEDDVNCIPAEQMRIDLAKRQTLCRVPARTTESLRAAEASFAKIMPRSFEEPLHNIALTGIKMYGTYNLDRLLAVNVTVTKELLAEHEATDHYLLLNGLRDHTSEEFVYQVGLAWLKRSISRDELGLLAEYVPQSIDFEPGRVTAVAVNQAKNSPDSLPS